MRHTTARALALALVLLAAVPCAAQAGWKPWMHWSGMHSAWPRPTGDGANWVTFDPATRTVYVANNNADTVSVLDAAGRSVATLPTGRNPVGTVVDPRTRTLYAANFSDGTVSVFDVANCNVDRVGGCGPARTTVAAGETPLGLALDPASDAVYVGHDHGELTVIDGATCNRSVTSGCGGVGHAAIGAAFPFADPSTRTIYLPGAPDGSTVALVDARTCAHGCAGPFPTAAVGQGGYTGGADPATHTVYIANADENTVSVIDGARCNATNVSGCGDAAPTIPVGPEPNSGVVVDDALHTLYVIAGLQDLMSVVDTAHCRAGDTSGCDRDWPTLQTAGAPFWSDIDPRSHTVYVAAFADDALSVLDGSSCSALRQDGCRHPAAAFDTGVGVGNMTIDRALHTIYATDANEHHLTLVDSTRCTPARCVRHVEPVPGVSGPADIAVDEATHTIYGSNQDDRTVVLLDANTCNVSRTGGCAPVGAPIPFPASPINLTIDPGTHAVYVTDAEDSRLYRIDGAHCRIGDRSNCTPIFGAVGEGPVGVELDLVTGTIYTANESGTVSVVDARHCCAAKAAVTVGTSAQDAAFDPGTRTLYVADFGEENGPGSVAVVDTRACNARVTSGCGQTPPKLATGRGPLSVTVDPASHIVYTADILHGTVSVLKPGARSPRFIATSVFPNDVLLNGGNVYATSGFDRTLTVAPLG